MSEKCCVQNNSSPFIWAQPIAFRSCLMIAYDYRPPVSNLISVQTQLLCDGLRGWVREYWGTNSAMSLFTGLPLRSFWKWQEGRHWQNKTTRSPFLQFSGSLEDEIIIELFPQNSKSYVRQRTSNGHHSEHTITTVKYRWWHHDALGVLFFSKDMEDGQSWWVEPKKDNLERKPVGVCKDLKLGWLFTFQQDDDPKHKVRATRGQFKTKQIHLSEWTSQSTDLEPFESLWQDLKTAVDKCSLSNLTDLELFCKERAKIFSH